MRFSAITIAAFAAIQTSCLPPVAPDLTPVDSGVDVGTYEDPSAGLPPGVDPFQRACAGMADAGCPEGLNPRCAAVLQRATEYHFINYHVGCLILGKTPQDFRKCGPGVKCVQ